MTEKELIQKLTTSTLLQDEIFNVLAKCGYGKEYADYNRVRALFSAVSPIAQQVVLDHVGNHNDNLARELQKIAHQNTNCTAKNVIELLPLAVLPKIFPKYSVTKEKERRKTELFNVNAKTLTLDTFSFTIFEKYLLANKKLSGKDSIRYLNLLPNPPTEQEQILYAKYTKVIWENSAKKSLALSKRIKESYHRYANIPDDNKAFLCLDETSLQKIHTPYSKDVFINTYTYKYLSRKYNIPMMINYLYLGSNEVHEHITGVRKHNTLETLDVYYAIDRLNILNHMIKTAQDTYYYKLAKAQLLDELKNNSKAGDIQKILSSPVHETIKCTYTEVTKLAIKH